MERISMRGTNLEISSSFDFIITSIEAESKAHTQSQSMLRPEKSGPEGAGLSSSSGSDSESSESFESNPNALQVF